ncbi:class F sortase [Janibacter sp. GS2]|uniref:class F sortase n=1 Tax=Janibacter sp. GS2 TaxID=3442646 RepID=UPI003EBA1D2F
MDRLRRSRAVVLAAVALPLVLAACGGGVADSTSGSTSSTSSTSTTTGSSTSTAAARSGSPTSHAPDPDIAVTPAADRAQSAAERAAGRKAADGTQSAHRLRIPAVGLSTSIGPQGLRDGKVDPAAGEVIWFTGYDRVRPGATGTTVIAGHVVNPRGPDEFAALEQLETGDGVVLDYPGGERLRFEITGTDIVDKEDLTTDADVWGHNSERRRVVLITCDDELGFREDGHRAANFVAVAELPS